MTTRTISGVCLVWALAFTSVGSAAAQTSTGGLRGFVRDNTGGMLVGVTVAATSPARIGAPALQVSDAQGLFSFQNLPVGEYTLTFELQGFNTVRRENIRVEVGRPPGWPHRRSLRGRCQSSRLLYHRFPAVDGVRYGGVRLPPCRCPVPERLPQGGVRGEAP